MQTLLIIACTLAALVATTIAAPAGTCDEAAINATMIGCLTQNGLSLEDAMRFVPQPNGMIKITEDDLKRQCDHKAEYYQAGLCITAELSVCSPDANLLALMPNMNKSMEIMKLTCDDPKVRLDCMVMVSKYTKTIQACVTAKYDFSAHLQSSSMQDVICESSKVGVDCAVQLIEKCDPYTATVVRKTSELSLPQHCNAEQ